MNWRSITFRLVFLYCGLLLVLGVSFSLFTVMSFERYTRETIRADVSTRAAEVWGIVQTIVEKPSQLSSLVEQRFSPAAQDRFIRISLDGRTVYRSGAPAGGSFDPAGIPLSDVDSGPENVTYGKLTVYARRFVTPTGHAVVIESGRSDAFAKGMEISLVTSLAMGLPVLLFAAALGGYVLIRQALYPVELMIKAAEAISFKNPRNRLPLMGTGDRVEALGLALNRMLDRLDSAFQHANRFSSDAAHELRTPLAIIQGELEFAVAGRGLPFDAERAIGNVLEEVTRLSNIVDSLLMLSRMDRQWGQRSHSGVDLYALAAETIEQMQLVAAEKSVTLRGPTGGKAVVTGDRDRLKQILVNLLDNGIKYNVCDGFVSVDVGASSDGARITVVDSGIGIAPEYHEYIFDRFYRVSTNRGETGAGLGLAIVRSICHAHGGTIDVASRPGTGSTFCVKLPITSPEVAALPESSGAFETHARESEAIA
jgi:signal transduction histidine kinase